MRRLVIGVTLLAAISFGYTLFTESFDAAWSPNTPPAGWRIYHSDPLNVGDDDWHRDSGRAPWDGHLTPFAAILPSVTQDATPDSLISPILDCRGYDHVTLRCSTNFLDATPNPYAAQIAYSVDSGLTFPYVLQTYNAATGTICESLVLDQARDRAGVVVAWVFNGDLNDITSWYVDDVTVTGDSLYLWDIKAGPIVTPGAAVVRTGLFAPTCRFRNLGDTIQRAIPVACSLYDNLGNGLAGWTATLDSLWSGWPETVAVFAPAYSLTPGDYSIKFWCYADSDLNRANDTAQMGFQAVNLYDMATTAIAWPGDTIWPGYLSPSARFRNLGDTVQTVVPVACTLYDNAMNVVATWNDSIGPIQPSAETLLSFTPPFHASPGNYFIRFWCSADSDYVRANDTLGRNFAAWTPPGVLFAEDFDTTWSTNNPPPGWRIIHSAPGDSGRDDWHRENANTAPWTNHPTPFAAIGPIMTPDAPPDSLISPTINCAGYRNITLVCSTYFYRWSSQPYIARLIYSINGGATWLTLHDYYVGSSPGPVLESLDMDQAAGKPNVKLAWVYDGDINYIQWWSVDDIMVFGDPMPAWDVWCRRINQPPLRMTPGPLQPAARFRNLGDSIQYNVPVACSLYDNAMVGLAAWTDTIDTLLPQTGEKVGFFDPPYNLPLGQYFIKFWCAADSDYDRSNDTLTRSFQATLQKELSYDDGSAAEYKSWPVGHYGWGVKLNADTFPVYIESLKVRLEAPSDPNYCGYQLAVFLDDGTGQPGKLYLKTPIQYATAGTAAWNSVFLADTGEQLVMPTGQFYVFYLQVGEPPECPALGRDASRDTTASYWEYRNGTFRPDSTPGDFMIRAVVNLAPVTPALVDLRALYVDQPLYDFVQRPFDAPITPKARADNFGSQTVSPATIQCDILGPGGVLLYSNVQALDSLVPGQDTLVTFPNWVPTTAERCTVVLRTSITGGPDSVPQNDEKRFSLDVLKGAYTGSSALRYGWIDSDTTGGPTFAWIDTNGFNRVALGDNSFINIYFEPGMHFPYYDSTYDYVFVSANGWVALGSSSPGGTLDTVPDKLPIPAAPNRCIYAWWDNLTQAPDFGDGMVYYRRFGVEPNRYMVLVFENVNRVGTDSANGITFELIFRENGTILCQYKDVVTGDLNFDNGKNASIGLENKDGTDGLNYLYARPPMSTAVHDLANRLSPGRAILFQPETRDAAALEIVRPAGYEFPGLITPQAKIQNYGTITDSIRVFMHIGLVYAQDTLITGLAPGESTIVSFESFNPWDAQLGTYTAVCSVRMVGDVDSSNNATSKFVTVATWVRRADIPAQYRKRKVKNAGLCYAPTTGRLYALKGSNSADFWTYSIASDSWDTLASVPLAPSGSKPRDGAHLTFDPSHGNLGSIWALKGGGRPDFYRYDIATDTWYTQKSAVVTYQHLPPPGFRDYRAPKKGAAIEYVPEQGAQGSVFVIPGSGTNYIWYYDIAGDSWTYPHDTLTQAGVMYWPPYDVPYGQYGTRCKFGSDLAYLNGKLYVLKGSGTLEAYGFTPGLPPSDDPWRDTLDQVTFKGPRYRNVKAGGSLVGNGDRLYALKGGNTQEFWRYRVDKDTWHQLTDIPLALSGKRVKVKRGSGMASVDSTIYCLKGSTSYEFWQYKPGADTVPWFLGDRPDREGVMADKVMLDLSRPWLVAYPNPTRIGLTISYNLTATAPTRLRVYDAAGKLIANLWDAARPRGRYVAHWNALAADGGSVASGVYFVKLESGDSRLTQKFIVQH